MFFEALPSLVDRLIQLLTIREERAEKQFKEIVERIFDGLQGVHGDYLKLFEGTKAELISGANLRSARRLLSEGRLAFEPARQSSEARSSDR